MTNDEKKLIEKMLDNLILSNIPGVETRPKYGGILYTLKPEEKEGQFCGVFVYKKHVQLAFSLGTSLKDPTGMLEGTGKFRRHINFKSAEDLNEKVVLRLLNQAAKLS